MNEFLIIHVEDETNFTIVGCEENIEDAKEFIKNDREFFGERMNLAIYKKVE